MDMRSVWGRQNMLQRHVPLSGAWRVELASRTPGFRVRVLFCCCASGFFFKEDTVRPAYSLGLDCIFGRFK